MVKKRKVFGYMELMNALDGANRRELIAGILVQAVTSWQERELTDYSMTAVLSKCNDRIKALGGNPYECR